MTFSSKSKSELGNLALEAYSRNMGLVDVTPRVPLLGSILVGFPAPRLVLVVVQSRFRRGFQG